MSIQESGEMYLESILVLSKENPSVRAIDISEYMGFSKPSVCVAMRNLREHGYITTDSNGLISLTESGLEVAKHVFCRHETITNWLIKIGVNPDRAAIDACRIEHVISEESFECLKKFTEKY